MRLVVDMNLSPEWVPLLESYGWRAQHWSQTGPANAPDTDLMRWAREQNSIVLTQDLDFPHLLYATQESGPSVILLRMDNEFDATARQHVCHAISQAKPALLAGALLTISGNRIRLRHLPII